MSLSRRHFLQSTYAVGLCYSGLLGLESAFASTPNERFELVPDPSRLIDLPKDFSYTRLPSSGGRMADGFMRPGRPDGMACFAHPTDASKCILTRNHENWPDTEGGGPFGDDNTLVESVPEEKLYDRYQSGAPFNGGVTNVIYDLKERRVERDFLTLAGTTGNCAGGATPWGTWLSCEESSIGPDEVARKPHGFVFEVPASANGLVNATPLTAMGRFAHEAAAVDPFTNIIYMTEDNGTGLFYRFLPNEPGALQRGGRLQALAIRGWRSAKTSNWPREWGGEGLNTVAVGQRFEVDWIDLLDVEAPDGDLAERGHAAGAAQFTRGEGMAFGIIPGEDAGSIYFNCTNGGVQRAGQVWRYNPSTNEGKPSEKNSPGVLELIYESPSADVLDFCDNLAFAPWGDLIVCEDGPGENYLRGISPKGEVYDLAHNSHDENSEFCGACFSPDGSVLFVNVQEPGFTFAIEGPWETLRS